MEAVAAGARLLVSDPCTGSVALPSPSEAVKTGCVPRVGQWCVGGAL